MSNYDKGPLDRILSATIEGLQSGDLSGLNDAVEESVTSVLSSVGEKLNKIGDVSTNGNPTPMSQHREAYSNGDKTRQRQKELEAERAKRNAALKKEAAKRAELAKQKRANSVKTTAVAFPSPFRTVGNVSSVLYMVGGGVGMGFSTLSMLSRIGQLIVGRASLGSFAVGGAFLLFFASMINVGVIQKRRLEKAKRYTMLIGRKQYMDIKDLALATNQSERRTLSDLKKMLKKGFFPQGHLDAEKTTVMLSDSVYNEYLKNVQGRKALEGSNKEIVDTTARVVDDNSELSQMINEGNAYITRLHSLNQDIPGEVITSKLNRLEIILRELFECVKKHPEQMPRMHEVMNYYLPTVMKLVEAYKEYDGITEAGSEILDAKKQIEGSIDTINSALRKILNNLFRDSVWDVTTDATVLNTMLTQKGLVSQFATESNSDKKDVSSDDN